MTGLLTRPIPSTGETLPVIGLGTWQTFDVGSNAAEQASLEAAQVRRFGRPPDRLVANVE